MKTAIVKLKGRTPYSQSKAISSERAAKETAADHEERVWRERLHADEDGEVFIPPMAFKNCVSEGAKYNPRQIPGKGKSTYTKHFEAGVMVLDKVYLGIKRDDVKSERLFVPSDGKRGGPKRVWKRFPIIHEWQATVVFHIFDDTITKDVFEEVIGECGRFIGIGRFRPRNNGFYGTFEVISTSWS